MNFSSITGKNWIFKKFENSDVKKYSENYHLKEIVARLIAIRKDNIDDVNPTRSCIIPPPTAISLFFLLKLLDNNISNKVGI